MSDYVAAARILLLDQVPTYRYPDSDLVLGLSLAFITARPLRPDLFLTQSPPGSIPSFSANDSTAVVIDPSYSMPLVWYMCGFAQMRDEESTQDSRAMAFMAMFHNAMVGVTQ